MKRATRHNTDGLRLVTGVGFKYPVLASFANLMVPSVALVGFQGQENALNLETSNAVERSSQKTWDMP